MYFHTQKSADLESKMRLYGTMQHAETLCTITQLLIPYLKIFRDKCGTFYGLIDNGFYQYGI
jgi:hypothetical protein